MYIGNDNKDKGSYKRNKERSIFVEVERMPLTEVKDVVISAKSSGGYSIAQEVSGVDAYTNQEYKMYMKGAIILTDVEQMKEFRSLLDDAIKKIEVSETNEDWEEEKF